MSIREQIEHLQQGIDHWNKWKKSIGELDSTQIDLSNIGLKNTILKGIDFSEVDLRGADLRNTDLRDADLSEARLVRANLADADLIRANLYDADCCEVNFIDAKLSYANLNSTLIEANLSYARCNNADFSNANLSNANLQSANLEGANLTGADLTRANLNHTNFKGANLEGAKLTCSILREATLEEVNLIGANFSGAQLFQTNFTSARIGGTIWGNVDLQQGIGLETIQHIGPSTIGIDTLLRSEGNISESLLRGSGITSATALDCIFALAKQQSRYQTCLISYSIKDQAFAARLYDHLQNRNISCWSAPDNAIAGITLFSEKVRMYDKWLLVLSENFIQSCWIDENDIEEILKREHQQNKQIIYPIKLDNTINNIEEPWATTIQRTRSINDFIQWKHYHTYVKTFNQLLHDLNTVTLIDG